MNYRLLLLTSCLAGCTAAFEAGESLNRATTNVATDPARYLWSAQPVAENPAPASAPVAASAPAETVK